MTRQFAVHLTLTGDKILQRLSRINLRLDKLTRLELFRLLGRVFLGRTLKSASLFKVNYS
jgi:hypothetical protein